MPAEVAAVGSWMLLGLPLCLHTGLCLAAHHRPSCAACPSRRWLLELPVEEGEVKAMEAVLRYCYEGDQCDKDDGNPGVLLLLQMVVLADR